jgi:light-regulated signal transduction histidine kinase (bacteriophytochrome)
VLQSTPSAAPCLAADHAAEDPASKAAGLVHVNLGALVKYLGDLFAIGGSYAGAEHEKRAAGKGTGLKLPRAYSIVKKHNGRVEVERVVGAGSTFRLILPVQPASLPEDGEDTK